MRDPVQCLHEEEQLCTSVRSKHERIHKVNILTSTWTDLDFLHQLDIPLELDEAENDARAAAAHTP